MTAGLLAEFDTAEAVLAAARQSWQDGYRRLDAFAPYPIPELSAAVGHPTSRLPWAILAGGLLGGGGAFYMMWYATVVSLPQNVGGRPWCSTPSYIPITFELTVLGASLISIIALLIANGLPRLSHPLFGVPAFRRASIDRFFLYIEAGDARFDGDGTRAFLEQLHPLSLTEVAQ